MRKRRRGDRDRKKEGESDCGEGRQGRRNRGTQIYKQRSKNMERAKKAVYVVKLDRCMCAHTHFSVSLEMGRVNSRLGFLFKTLKILVSECKKWNGSHGC